MKQLRIGAWIITLIGLLAIVGPFAVDWNQTDIYNPLWPPHAKFHNAQTMLLGLGLGLSALWFACRRVGDARSNLLASVTFAGLYWITQAGSLAFPGTGLFDPEFAPGSAIPRSPIMDAVLLGLLVIAYRLESKRLVVRKMAAA